MGNQNSGGYSEARKLEAHDKEVFEAAMKGLVGVEYTPLLVATQVVAGTNYRFFCDYKTITATPVTGKALVTIFEALPANGGGAVITDIVRY